MTDDDQLAETTRPQSMDKYSDEVMLGLVFQMNDMSEEELFVFKYELNRRGLVPAPGSGGG